MLYPSYSRLSEADLILALRELTYSSFWCRDVIVQ